MSWLESFSSTLSAWQWLVLLAIPPAIVLLYFLKLKRRPLEVPSTYLWHRTIEDLHVNSIWQKLRQNLLLFLQLLLVLLAILACLRPSWLGTRLTGDRYIFLLDTSASMAATDVSPTRLEAAKQQVIGEIDALKPGAVAMVVSFSDRPVVEQPFTNNRRLLKQRVRSIVQTDRPGELEPALRVAAGLANPGRSGNEEEGDQPAAEALPATVVIYSDGGFRSTAKSAMGNLTPQYIIIGSPEAKNAAITAFGAEQDAQRPDRVQVFARLENFTAQPRRLTTNLLLNNQFLDAASVDVPAQGSGGVEFTIQNPAAGFLELTLEDRDHLPLDNQAFAPLNPPRRANVLVVTPQNDALQQVLRTDYITRLADVRLAQPSVLTTQAHQNEVAQGLYDLILYDQCAPQVMPRANTYFIGRLPADPRWSAGSKTEVPQIIDTNLAHPLMQFVNLGDVQWIAECTPLKPPPGSTMLVDSDAGPLLTISARDAFEDLVQGFEIVGQDQNGAPQANTDWPIRTSFPVFLGNVLTYLGGSRTEHQLASVLPGQPIPVRTNQPVDRITVRTPDGRRIDLARGQQNTFLFSQTDRCGVYEVQEGSSDAISRRFAVNLFDPVESNLVPRTTLETAYERIEGQAAVEPTRREAWRYLLVGALVVLVAEWYIYNRRVYV